MHTLSTVVLTTKGECKKANIQLTEEDGLVIDAIQKYFKKKDAPESICHYEYNNNIIFIFGYKKGKKGTENKTELPFPYSGMVLFGDILVIASLTDKWDYPIPFTIDQWNLFANEGDEEEEEEEEEEEQLSDDEKAVKDVFDDEDESLDKDILIDKEEEEEEPVVVKKKRAPVYAKVDINVIKEEIPITSEPESNPLRIKCLKYLSFLEKDFTQENIRLLEKAIFESAYLYSKRQYIACNWKVPQFVDSYQQIMRTVISNIHPESPVNNTRLLVRVKEGEFELHALPFMSAYEMYPEKWFMLKDKLLQREQKILEGNKSRATDQFKCRRCQKSECVYYELQTRSADEPMTIFITCLNCGKEWRQGG
jgi:DNA-directed RNA polymerase subunit M/transcription elongation factor TFIIS